MDVKEYKKYLTNLSECIISKIDTEPLEALLINDKKLASELISYRSSLLSDRDYDNWGGLLSTGLFMQFEPKIRLACFCICIEASTIRHKTETIKSCAKYSIDLPLFSMNKHLYDNYVRKDELIDYNALKRLTSSYCFSFSVKHNKGFGLIDRRLPRTLLDRLDDEYARYSKYIRIDPNRASMTKIDYLEEAVVNYPDPKWWADLLIYNNKEKGSSYQLLKDPKDYQNYWDYCVKGIRRLEYHAERRDDNQNHPYLSMMIEELEEHPNVYQPEESYLIGRMIHLDTKAAVGESFSSAKMMHLDLAYNYYFGDSVKKRLNQDLSVVGKVEDATIRTHIFRIENVKLSELFPIAFSFFQSQSLVYEWCHYQFNGAEFDSKHRIANQ